MERTRNLEAKQRKSGKEQTEQGEREGKQRGGSWIENKHEENPNNLLFFLQEQE